MTDDLEFNTDILTQSGALDVAPALLGLELVTFIDGKETAGRIVEVEVYLGELDPASHAFRGQTPRTAPMFARGGHIYTYRSYGIHTCMNIVTGQEGTAEAVLIRAIEPTVGLDIMAGRRGLTDPQLLARGPGRLTQALGITLADSGSRLGKHIQLRPGTIKVSEPILTSPRIGVSSGKEYPWRFYLGENRFVSGR